MTEPQSQEKTETGRQDQADQNAAETLFLGAAHGYWAESRRPLASLLFVLPLLIVYEVGILCLGPAAVRNGVDIWLRQLLDWMGFGQYFLLPALTIGILLSWQYTSRQPWRISRGVLGGMLVECLILAFCLRWILHLQSVFTQSLETQSAEALPMIVMAAGEQAARLNLSATFSNLVMFLGAGIFEELLFRMIFLTATIWVLRRLGMKRILSVLSAIVLTSLLFSAAHYIGAQGETPQLFSFIFRFIAGSFFCVLFLYRGFGIAAGTHAAYDIVVGIF